MTPANGGRTSEPRCDQVPTPQAESPRRPASDGPIDDRQSHGPTARKCWSASYSTLFPPIRATIGSNDDAPPRSSTHARNTRQPDAAPSGQAPTRHQRSTPPTDRLPPAQPRPSRHRSRCRSHWQDHANQFTAGHRTLPTTYQSTTSAGRRFRQPVNSSVAAWCCAPRSPSASAATSTSAAAAATSSPPTSRDSSASRITV